ncbi:hypothetical protein SAMIE_1003190 [Sphingobium amiense]|uniref:Phage gp6-like head-tail connector protein n=1 Tax=Sphingobium amiense TaxID=135719 RepID=A0A494W0W5_9SPHN|nr:phage head-tail connector protein [Sphingobium amiense]BBD96818.1 hypothetical protein SAMIE_1003190 [Sphingobium amiense]
MLMDAEDGALPASLAELKTYLRIAGDGEDAVLNGLLRGAGALCERFTGQWLIVRQTRETLFGPRAAGAWQRLTARPVVAIESVGTVGADGAVTPLPVDAYAVDIDGNGEGWVRIARGGFSGTMAVTYRAGLASDADAVPEALRQGVVRLAAEHYLARGGDSATPPAVVSALWRPWRRMRLA